MTCQRCKKNWNTANQQSSSFFSMLGTLGPPCSPVPHPGMIFQRGQIIMTEDIPKEAELTMKAEWIKSYKPENCPERNNKSQSWRASSGCLREDETRLWLVVRRYFSQTCERRASDSNAGQVEVMRWSADVDLPAGTFII